MLPRSLSLPHSVSPLPKNCEPLRDVGGLLNRMDDDDAAADADGIKNGSKRGKKSSPDDSSSKNNNRNHHNLTIATKAS